MPAGFGWVETAAGWWGCTALDCRVRHDGQSQIQALSEEQVTFTYIMHTDLGGDLSAGLINPRVVESTYADVKQLQMLAEK